MFDETDKDSSRYLKEEDAKTLAEIIKETKGEDNSGPDQMAYDEDGNNVLKTYDCENSSY